METKTLQQVARPSLVPQFVKRLTKINPGLSGKTIENASMLMADSGLEGLECLRLLEAVYRPNNEKGIGQSTRAKYFTEALRSRWGYRLEKAASSLPALKTLVGEVESLAVFRDTIREDLGFNISFLESMLLDEIGITPDSFMVMHHEAMQIRPSPIWGKKTILDAAKLVQSGKASTIEGALEFLLHKYGDLTEQD